MSLGSWFRDYVYITLGGNRVSKGRYLFNIFVVWALTGLWHGGAWNFVIWGLFYAVLLMIEKMWMLKHLKKENCVARFFSHAYVLLAVMVGFVIFNAKDMAEAISYLGAMFGMETMLGAGRLPFVSAEAIYYLKSYGIIFALAIVGATPLAKKAWTWIEAKTNGVESSGVQAPARAARRILVIVEFIGLLVLLISSTAFLVDGSFNPFLYFRF